MFALRDAKSFQKMCKNKDLSKKTNIYPKITLHLIELPHERLKPCTKYP